MNQRLHRLSATALVATCALAAHSLRGQQAPAPSPTAAAARGGAVPATTTVGETDAESVVKLTPFEVSAQADKGYVASTTLAGNRLNADLRDLGNSISVITSQFMQDIGATSNETLLQYTLGTEVGNIGGNFAGVGDSATLNESGRFTNPNQNTRVRGLTSADNTRDFFLTDIPWDGYAVDRVELQRGANSILFGQGSPAGIINTGTKQAAFRNSSEVEARFDNWGSFRSSLDVNRTLVRNQLAFRVLGLYNDEKFQQEPAYNLDKRLYGSVRYEPAFLKKAEARTVLKANLEFGAISSNRPRSLPPIDRITPWFRSGTYQGRNLDGSARTFSYLNRETFNPFQLQDDNTGRPNHGQQRPSINGGPNAGQVNPAYNPWVGNFAQSFGGPLAYFSGNGAPTFFVGEIRTTRGIGPTGAVDGGIGGFAFHRQGGVATQAAYARAARLPFSEFGVYKNYNLADSSVFDFYNNLIDGPNKSEWQNFRAFSVSLAQTFLKDRIGFEATYNQEFYKNGQLSLISGGDNAAIHIDFMNVYSDGTPTGRGGEPFQDGTANPNVGRPFISDSWQFGNNSYKSERESGRFTLFGTHDFVKSGGRTTLNRLLGRHTVTGLYSQDRQGTDRRNWQRYAILDPAYRQLIGAPAATKFTDNLLAVNPVIYLGPSLASRSSAGGASIPRAMQGATVSSAAIRVFDSTWAARPGVDPAAPWDNDYYVVGDTRRASTQAENPANYNGWRTVTFNVTDSEQGNRDALTTSARLTRSRVFSRVAVWQGHFWDNALVGTYGVRKDVAKAWAFSRDSNSSPGFGQLDLGPTFRLPDNPQNRLEVDSKTWSAVAHLNRFLPKDSLPINVSLFYSKSENFQPAANRVDFYGEPIAAPQGRTTDKGIYLETKNGKFSVRINRYETSAANASSNALGGAWFLGTSQAWAGNWANIFEFDLGGATLATQNQGSTGRFTYSPGPGENQDQADARERNAVSAWRAWQKKIDPRFYRAWGVNFNPAVAPIDQVRELGASAPNGFTLTEDSLSKGYEIEFGAQPTRNWRISANAAKTDATRRNIGGAALADFVAKYEDALKNTAAGDLRIWWGGAGNETTLFQWNSNVGSEFTSRRLQEGTNAPELREWRFNAINTYSFTEGRLKGVDVGGGIRWQDSVVIGYKPLPGRTASDVSFDIANPYRGPTETNVDLWVGYGRKNVWRGIDWRVQLNVRNVAQHDSLIPVTAQPDGSPAGFRIAPVETWSLQNTFKF